MERRQLGTSPLHITPIGLGAWAIGGGDWMFGWGPQPDAQSIATIHHAIRLGLNWIDTSPVYGLGQSEAIIARALRSIPLHDRPHIFTKCSLVWDDLGNVSRSFDPRSIRRETESSLRRLGVEAIDLLQLELPSPAHSPWTSETGSIELAWAALADLQREGKIRSLGVANANVVQLARLWTLAPIASLQAPYSLLCRGLDEAALEFCRANRIGVLAASPLASGLLTGRMTRQRWHALPHNDWRRHNAGFQRAALEEAPSIVERLREVGSVRRAGPGQVAIAWTLHQPDVTAAIAGARRPDQLDEIAGAADIRLTAGELAALTTNNLQLATHK
jgi:aryl-alcohol dehydrogenase-like predicted oxidoreductase